MEKPRNYEDVQAYQSFKKLPKGGYVCEIKKIEEAKSKAGNDILKVFLDIAEGEYKGMFMERWNESPASPDKKWGMISIILVLDTTTGDTNRSLKGFLTSVEESNPGFVVDKCWGADFCKFFKGKLVGCVFGDEWFKGTDGTLHSSTKPRYYMSVDKIKKGDFTIPQDKYPADAGSNDNSFGTGFQQMNVDEDDLPF